MIIKEIKKLKDGEVIISSEAIIKVSEIKQSVKGNYLNLVLSDKSGDIGAKIWSWTEDTKPDIGTVITYNATVNEYNGSKGLIISSFVYSDTDPNQFIKSSNLSKEELACSINDILNEIDNENLLTIIYKFKKLYSNEFFTAPAAVGVHHNFQGGLAQHTLEVLLITDRIINIYKNLGIKIDKSLALAGAYLHDCGKVKCYCLNNGVADMTYEGKLIDHICSGLSILDELKFDGLDEKTFLRLKEIIASHHGELEYGSPVKPHTLESLIISMADNISAKVICMDNEISNINGQWGNKGFFGVRLLGRE